jgi:putative transposase
LNSTGSKKNLELSIEQKRLLVEPENLQIPIFRQCELLGLSRSSFYYEPAVVDEYNLLLMRLIDEQYTQTPFYGIRRMTACLRAIGHKVNRKRIGRLMRLMGLEAIYPKPNLSKAIANGAVKYPYLLRGLVIQRPNHVWSTDITYIRLKQGFVYLVAVMDWFSRYVLSWEISNSLDTCFCLSALDKAFGNGVPEIFNSDQGSQFTSDSFLKSLELSGTRISWDGRGRAMDNIFVERLWRSVKHEEVYLKDYANVPEAISGIDRYFKFYNTQRPHQSLGYKTPEQVFFGSRQH